MSESKVANLNDYRDPENQKVKPGWQSTEFYISIGVIVLTILTQMDWIKPGTQWDKIVASVLQLMTAVGYSFARAQVKAQAALAAAQVRVAKIQNGHAKAA